LIDGRAFLLLQPRPADLMPKDQGSKGFLVIDGNEFLWPIRRLATCSIPKWQDAAWPAPQSALQLDAVGALGFAFERNLGFN